MHYTRAINNSYIIPFGDNFLFYSPLTGISALVNRTGALEIKKQLLFPVKKRDASSKFNELTQEILSAEIKTPMKKSGRLKPDFLGIIPTRGCNGACNYCDFEAGNAKSEKMSYDMAVKAVDWYFNLLKADNRKTPEIHFFGGEPMMASDVVEVVVHRARLLASENNMLPFFEISTNGQYNNTKAGFLGDYFNKVILSLDGNEKIQNRHRPLKRNKNSFDKAYETARIISDSNSELYIRCCVSRESVPLMEEFTSWLCRNFRLAAINFEVLCSSALTDLKGLFPPSPLDFAYHFLKSRKTGDTFGVHVVCSSDILPVPVTTSCPTGNDTIIISPGGRISNCYQLPEKWISAGLDLDIGQVSDGEIHIEKKKVEAVREMVLRKPGCSKCFCRWSCAGGCHISYSSKHFRPHIENFCIQTRIISAFTILTGLIPDYDTEILLNDEIALRMLAENSSDLLKDFC